MADLSKFPRWGQDYGDVQQVNDELWERFTLARKATQDQHGITVYVSSGWRDSAQQQILYDCYINRLNTGKCRCNSCNLAARPGTSNHERGLALDLRPGPRSIPAARDTFYEYGLIFPVGPEDWHAELDPRRRPLPNQPPPPPERRNPTMHTVSNQDGRMEEFDLFWTQVVHRWQDSTFQTWSQWVSMDHLPEGQGAEDLSVGRTHDGRLEVTVRCPGGIRYRAWQTAPSRAFDRWVPA